MELTEKILGDLIEPCIENNSLEMYGLESLKGISIQKCFIQTKAEMSDVSLLPYIKVEPDSFAYVPTTSRNGGKITIALNQTDNTYLVSSSYQVLKIKDKEQLLPRYLFLWFCRSEFDRYARFHSWGSAREVFTFEEMCSIPIKLPSLPVQQKAVDAYNALNANLATYKDGLENTRLTCTAFIEKLAKEYQPEEIGPLIEESDQRNNDLKVKLAQGISNNKYFQSPVQIGDNRKAAKIVHEGEFAWNRATTRNGEKISIALRKGDICFVSSAYGVFRVKDNDKLIPEYLTLWFNRSEFDRYARYYSKGSAHEFFEYSDMCQVKIPIPPKPIQQSIVDIYHAQYERQAIADRLSNTIKEICPVLIRNSLSEQI